MKPLEYWTVENTGWSAKQSWLKTGGTRSNPLRFDSFNKALKYAKKEQKESDTNTLWRVVYTHIERNDNKEVRTRIYTEL